MSDAYDNLDSRRSNSPVGYFRTELVRVTTANEVVLSGSPIEYFVHADYQTGAYREGGGNTLKHGIEAIYNHDDTAWVDPDAHVTAVSDDGYIITLDDGAAVGDLVEVYYYARPTGTGDHETGAQVGDVRTPETVDAIVQKINDCPPLDFEGSGLVFDHRLCYSTVALVDSTKTTLAKYAAVQVGTWQTSDTPFYVTSIIITAMDDTDPISYIYITVDGGTERTIVPEQLMNPAYGIYYYVANLGLVECESDFVVAGYAVDAGNFPTSWETRVSGWHL